MEINNRFFIPYYTDKTILEEVGCTKFSQLCLKSQTILHDRLTGTDLQEVLKNKSVSMIFLDKISKLIGKHHPDRLEAKMFMEGPSSFSSMELIRHLTLLKNNPSLNKEIVQNLEKWISSEQACLLISVIFDAWSTMHEELLKRSTNKGRFPALSIQNKIEPPLDEIEIFTKSLAEKMRNMQPCDKFKMPAGSLQHITRLEFTKNANGTFDIIHFNTGLGVISIDNKKNTACKYLSIPAEKLENASFWETLVQVKMQGDMSLLNDLLKNLNPERPPLDLNPWLKKPLQDSESCSFHAAEAEFKHSFITSFSTLEEGWEAYKKCTSLMAQNAVQHESPFLEPSIAKSLISKELVRHRYLDWMTHPEKLEETKLAYIQAIVEMGRYSEEENHDFIKNLTPLMALSILDKRLNEGLGYTSYEQLMKITNKYDFLPVGYKQLKWLESTREVFRDVIEFTGWKGELLLKIKEVSSTLLSGKLNGEIQSKLNYAILDKPEITSLLTAYLMREEKTVGNTLLHTLIKKNIIAENFLYDQDIIYSHILNSVKADPENAYLLSKKLVNEEILDKTHKTFLENRHFEIASRLGEQSKNPVILHETTSYYAKTGQIEKAVSLIKQNPEMDFTCMLIRMMHELCTENLTDTAVNLAHLVIDEENTETILQIVVSHLIKQGRLEDTIRFIEHLPKEYYLQDEFQDLIPTLTQLLPDGALKESILSYELISFDDFDI